MSPWLAYVALVVGQSFLCILRLIVSLQTTTVLFNCLQRT
jgi:hypothetical protein